MSIKFVNGNILTFPERDEDTIIEEEWRDSDKCGGDEGER